MCMPLFQVKVSKIEEVTDVSGYRKQAVFIDVSGDEWVESIIREEFLDKRYQAKAGMKLSRR